MKIKREIDTAKAKYSLEDINDDQFRFLRQALNHYAQYTHRCIPDKESPIGELVDKVEKMNESSLTIIN